MDGAAETERKTRRRRRRKDEPLSEFEKQLRWQRLWNQFHRHQMVQIERELEVIMAEEGGRLPQGSKARKDVPLYSGLFAYFPDALVEVARLSQAGNDKHNPGQPLHWSREKSNDHADCILRHQMDIGREDPDDGFLHEIKVAWRALAQAQLALEARGAPQAPGSVPPKGTFASYGIDSLTDFSI